MSTDSSDQVNSLESQQKYFYDYILRHPLWELCEIYVDEGISGTSTKKREAFNRMIEDAESGRLDIILTKEISRFARNTLDSLKFTRKLKSCGVSVIFMNDNINTLDVDSELRLTIMSSIAQEEVRKTSDRVKWGQRRLMEQGVVFGRDMLGYDVRDGKLIINEEGARTVRMIFHKYLDEGKGCHIIANELRDEGVKTSVYMKAWSYTSILRILKNEKYCGDLVQQKTYTPDYLTHLKKKNNGEIELVTIRNHHEPIISRERFEAAQLELARRKTLHSAKNGFANRYPLSGKIICGDCGATYIHTKRISSGGKVHNGWLCNKKQKNGKKHFNAKGELIGCSNHNIKDEVAQRLLMLIMADFLKDKQSVPERVISIVSEIYNSVKEESTLELLQYEIKKIEKKKERLLDMCLSCDIDNTEYKKGFERLNNEHTKLLEMLRQEKARRGSVSDRVKILDEIKSFVYSLSLGKTWNDAFYRSVTDRIIVYADGMVDVYLKCSKEKRQAEILYGRAELEAYK